MGLRLTGARIVAAVSTWGLQTIFRRPAANFPGKIGLKIDPQLIADLRGRIRQGSIVVVGTNGKTTVTNMLADALQASGYSVVCNRTGANLAYGVASALLHTDPVDWGVIESDELWLAHTLPQLQADYVLLLNLFRDQLDRCGEIDHVQKTIVTALEQSPGSTLIYNADDPQCAAIAAQVSNPSVAFGLSQDLGLPQNTVSDATMCQQCAGMLEYAYRQYGQLGEYHCPTCGFTRPALDVAVSDVQLGEFDAQFTLSAGPGCFAQAGETAAELADLLGDGPSGETEPRGKHGAHVRGAHVRGGAHGRTGTTLRIPFGGAYMVYNVAAVVTAALCTGASLSSIKRAVSAFNPRNGRLQRAQVRGRSVLLNLAKNPTGFNQNLKLVTQGEGPRVVGFFINDKEADGHDISWLWDIDFEELASRDDLLVFAGGLRGNDMQVRLKYAGIRAEVVDSAEDLFDRIADLPLDVRAFLIANYTALPAVKADVERLEDQGETESAASAPEPTPAPAPALNARIPIPTAADQEPVVIAHLFPDLLNLYGDGGNVTVLQRRLQWRGIPVEVRAVHHGGSVDLTQADLVFMGGGPDREQTLATQDLVALKQDLKDFVEADGPLLAICGGYQILGTEWLLGEDQIPGLGLVNLRTGRTEGGSTNRLIQNIVLRSDLADCPVVGFENHAGRTYLGPECKPFGPVISSVGCGNNEQDHADGVLYRNVIGTYLHGPLLGKNPQVADTLLANALQRWAKRTGNSAPQLSPLDDAVEQAANAVMCKRLGVS